MSKKFTSLSVFDRGPSEPFEVLHTGHFEHPITGAVDVTVEDLDTAVENFGKWKELGTDVPVDYDHGSAFGSNPEAAGWYESLERDGEKLLATVKWTDDAAEKLEEDKYRFFSPEFDVEFKSETGEEEGFTILAGGLTNRPFLRGMSPVQMSREARNPAEQWILDQIDLLAQSENLRKQMPKPEETAVEEVTETEVEETEATETTETEETTEPAPVAASRNEAPVKLSRSEYARLKNAADQVSELTSRLDKTESDLQLERFNRFFSRALREGREKNTEDTRKKWWERAEKYGLDETETLLFERPAETVPVRERGVGADSDTATGGASDPMNEGARHAFDRRAQALAEKESIPYVDAALRLADQEIGR